MRHEFKSKICYSRQVKNLLLFRLNDVLVVEKQLWQFHFSSFSIENFLVNSKWMFLRSSNQSLTWEMNEIYCDNNVHRFEKYQP